jgi:hypothetical protein
MNIDRLKPSVWSLRAAAQPGHHLNVPNHLEAEFGVQLFDGRPSTLGALPQSRFFITREYVKWILLGWFMTPAAVESNCLCPGIEISSIFLDV